MRSRPLRNDRLLRRPTANRGPLIAGVISERAHIVRIDHFDHLSNVNQRAKWARGGRTKQQDEVNTLLQWTVAQWEGCGRCPADALRITVLLVTKGWSVAFVVRFVEHVNVTPGTLRASVWYCVALVHTRKREACVSHLLCQKTCFTSESLSARAGLIDGGVCTPYTKQHGAGLRSMSAS